MVLTDQLVCPAEIAVLSNLAQVFDLLDSIKQIVNVRRQITDPEQTQVLRTLTGESRENELLVFTSERYKSGN